MLPWYPNSIIRNVQWFNSGHKQCVALSCIREKRGFVSLSRSVMNEIVQHSDCSKALRNPQQVDLCVLASFSCRVYADTQGRKVRPVAGLTEPDNHRPANTIHVLRPTENAIINSNWSLPIARMLGNS